MFAKRAQYQVRAGDWALPGVPVHVPKCDTSIVWFIKYGEERTVC